MHNVTLSTGGGWIAVAILIVAFYGEPDLADSLIYHFTEQQDGWKDYE